MIIREYAPGIGQAVADRTINRLIDGKRETWGDVAHRVALGNCAVTQAGDVEFTRLKKHLSQASLLMSGRHLQHGDETQPRRPQEVFTNCLKYNEKILTQEFGPIEIGTIAGEIVHVVSGDGVVRPARINAHGEQDLHRIVFRANKGGGGNYRKEVVATANHRWVLRDGTISTSLTVGDVLMPAPDLVGQLDPEAIVHGLIFGDGSAHKGRRDHGRPGVSVGRTYAAIRVCKQDVVRDQIHSILDAAGYRYTTPPHTNGDRVYYIGKLAHVKELPFTRDPEYIAGFIYGWWLADGRKNQFGSTEISTSDEQAATWLEDHAAYAGYNVTMHRVMERREGDGSYPNGKPLHCLRLRKGVEWKVEAIEYEGRGQVFCPEEPVTSSFVLANGLLTGNCSTSAASFLLLRLLLSGSGVGTDYSDHMQLTHWAQDMPNVVCTIDPSHPDVLSGEIKALSRRDAEHLYRFTPFVVHEVEDSREGWAEAVQKLEELAFKRLHDLVLILDFSKVRHRGQPIRGMQNRPASGPGPLMEAFRKIAAVKNSGMEPWMATMFVDHFLAECVLVGGARRAARMATKYWKDSGILDFIQLKRGGFLWSSNNSILVDEQFWRESRIEGSWANIVYNAAIEAAYHDGTGEPGFINVDKLEFDPTGIEAYIDGSFVDIPEMADYLAAKARACLAGPYHVITNPCGEIVLFLLGGYCVIADVVPFFAANDDDAEEAFRVAVRALIRTNQMQSLYNRETKRTNRIGVGLTGLFEFALKRFGYGWYDLVDEEKSLDFWLLMKRFSDAVKEEAVLYATELGVTIPHTATTVKPAGCASLDTTVKTAEGVMTMRELFARHGYNEEYLKKMPDATWLEPSCQMSVLDMNGDEKDVTKLYVNGVKEVFEITFEDGTVAKLTGNHRLMTNEGWKRVDELTEDDEIVSP